MVKREIAKTLRALAREYPVVTVTGPRQSGKTTLVKDTFPGHAYVSLEDPDTREMAALDPREFLRKRGKGMILDEIQRMPELLSYLQGIVDQSDRAGRYILTGSHQFDLFSAVTQSLAGRTAILKLLPFSIHELDSINADFSVDEYLLHGFYPRIHDRGLDPVAAHRNYFETYLQRDLRQLIAVKDLRLFQKFVRLCAGRIGQIFNASGLSNDVGVSVPTVNAWISILEASFILFLLEPYYENSGKRLIKSPKLYFYDVGLAAYLLGIESIKHVERDPLRGNLFENMVIAELVKRRFNQGREHRLSYYRDSNGNEVDVLYRDGKDVIPIEIKASSTFSGDFLKGLRYLRRQFPENTPRSYLVYAGDEAEALDDIQLVNYKNAASILPTAGRTRGR